MDTFGAKTRGGPKGVPGWKSADGNRPILGKSQKSLELEMTHTRVAVVTGRTADYRVDGTMQPPHYDWASAEGVVTSRQCVCV